MGIEPRFNMSDINSYLQKRLDTLDGLMLRNLNYLGMECVNLAKSLDTYTDRTGNLRNSIGYVVVKHGNVVSSVFEEGSRGPDYNSQETPGEVVGEAFAKSLAKEFGNGYAVIVVAGMEYASYVEDVKHLDVIAPAKSFAQTRINQIAQSIVNSMRAARW
ncbi:hypothetical protein AR686_07755 [Chryseobacterium aquaticum subsp. greenlandense]|uniref:Uncharacterized protein n=2 Tax=Chryseobacterium aquaticum TaxID=452084 RepID=A0A101CHS8_9FLAO|nr:hypothetical protein AR686_07755 [Chryseobacterium aquaticum subsp. greenlandense]